MNSFDEIYILDLHGNALKKERCPDGSKDENVFDIRQGVAIALFVKKKQGVKKECNIFHSEIWGLREEKYDWLLKNDIKTTKLERLSPKSEFYLFISRDEAATRDYETFWKVTDISPANSVGIVTSRDGFVIDRDKEVLKRRIRQFRDKGLQDEIIRQTFRLKDTSRFKLKQVRESLNKDEGWEDSIVQILYRPFDLQWIIYHDDLIERSRKEIMRHMMRENLSLCVGRAGQVVGLDKPWNIVFCSEHMEDFNLFYRGGNVNMPLYLYSEKDNPPKRSYGQTMMLFEPEVEYPAKKSNISSAVIEALKKVFNETPSPEQIFYYIYGVLYSNTYRTKYAEFLKIDFPRVPFTIDYELFKKIGEYGKQLVDLHLMKSVGLNNPIAKFQGSGDNKIEKPEYSEKAKRVYINKDQFFEGVDKDVWEYQIGGYHVLNKWLKDRKGRTLSLDDIKHYCKIVTALKKTIEIQKKIDLLYQHIEKEIIEVEKE